MRTITIIWVMTIGGVFHDSTNNNILYQEYLFKDLNDNYLVLDMDVSYSPNLDSMSYLPKILDTDKIPLGIYLPCKDTTYDDAFKAFHYTKTITINEPSTITYEEEEEDDDDDDDSLPPQVIGKSAFCTPY